MGEENCLVEGGQLQCATCAARLCLRKQVVNLALGNIDEMYCLECLAKSSIRQPEDVLISMKTYILSRECFKKEWSKYKDVSSCPAPDSCFPDSCFHSGEDNV